MLYIHVIFVGKENERVEFELNGLSDRKGICFVSKKKKGICCFSDVSAWPDRFTAFGILTLYGALCLILFVLLFIMICLFFLFVTIGDVASNIDI